MWKLNWERVAYWEKAVAPSPCPFLPSCLPWPCVAGVIGHRLAEQLGLAWGKSSLFSTGLSCWTAYHPPTECVWLVVWVKAQTNIYLAWPPAWGKWDGVGCF